MYFPMTARDPDGQERAPVQQPPGKSRQCPQLPFSGIGPLLGSG